MSRLVNSAELPGRTVEKIELSDITFPQIETTVCEEEGEYDIDQFSPGKKVTMHFELKLPGGEIVDSNFSGQPVEFTVGDGNVLAGFERALFGIRPGREHTFDVSAENAFGQSKADNIRTFPRFRFPSDLVLETGLMINFTDSTGNQQPGVVTDFDTNRVEVDFNHPLADRDIIFRVKIISISALTERNK